MSYRGRFAPSPTGELHVGSLVAALASFLDARHHGGQWLLRIEDLDPPREQAGATIAILKSLEAHHLFWDGEILYQSQRHAAYRAALADLAQRKLTYRCTCTRAQLQRASMATADDMEIVYPGFCRTRTDISDSMPAAIRLDLQKALDHLHLANPCVEFNDVFLGPQQQHLLTGAGDFVIHRKDGFFAYQLAVVVDDIHQGITHVIRGADLLESTARQILLFRLFNAPVPVYGHVPLVRNAHGQKLSKQNLAPPLDNTTPEKNILTALHFLGWEIPAELHNASLDDMLDWAIRHWAHSASAGTA